MECYSALKNEEIVLFAVIWVALRDIILTNKSVFSSVQSLSCVRLFATPWTAACQASLSITNSQSLPKLMSIKSVMPSNHLVLCHSLLLLPSIFPSIKVFSNDSTLRIRWAKHWNFSFSIGTSNEFSELISFRIDWFNLLEVQQTLQHHSSKAVILQRAAFFMIQLSYPYMTTGKTTALTIWTFVGDAWLIKSLTLGQQFLKYTERPLSEKTERFLSAFSMLSHWKITC